MRATLLRALLLLVPALAGAVDVPKLPALDIGVNATPSVKGAPVVPQISQLPTLPNLPSAAQIPTLPATQIPAVAPEPAAEPILGATIGERFLQQADTQQSRRGFLPWAEGLQRLQEAAQKAVDGQSLADAARPYFDGSAKIEGDNLSGGWVPAVPEGVVRVQIHEIRRAADVSRVIPDGVNSHQLIEGLMAGISKMAPYRIYTYHDSKGGRFTGIDLRQKPDLVDLLPEQQSHEVALIRKIQLYQKDLQVVVREDGKTPDLVVGGMVTELKSLIGNAVDLGFLVNKANTQVYKHAQRHALGDGAMAIDLTAENRVPVDRALDEINAWAAKPVGHLIKRQKDGEEIRRDPNALKKIYVFAKNDMKIFERQKDGSYALGGNARIPFVAPSTRIKRDVHTAQFLVKNGRHRAAANLVARARSTQKRSGLSLEPASPIKQAKERVDALKFLERLKKLSRRRRFGSVRTLWDNFKQVSTPGAVHEIQAAVDALLKDETEGELLQREVDVPRAALEKRGVTKTVTVYGSARVEPGSKWYEEARKFAELVVMKTRKKVAIVTGGGPGIMEAANRGAQEAGGRSIGHNIVLPREQQPNRYQSKGLSFNYQSFGARKSNMRHLAGAHVYFPGGFGTMDELFELLTLMQTGKIEKAPIVLVGGKEYWDEVLDFKSFARLGLISNEDLGLFKLVDDADGAYAAVSEDLERP